MLPQRKIFGGKQSTKGCVVGKKIKNVLQKFIDDKAIYFAETCIIHISYHTRWRIEITNICLGEVINQFNNPVAQIPQCTSPISHNHHFVTEICTCVHLYAMYALFACFLCVSLCAYLPVCARVWEYDMWTCLCLCGLIPVDFTRSLRVTTVTLGKSRESRSPGEINLENSLSRAAGVNNNRQMKTTARILLKNYKVNHTNAAWIDY